MKKPDEQKFNNMYTKLNVDQKYIFKQIISQKTKIHFIDGPGGFGKTSKGAAAPCLASTRNEVTDE